jgi:glycosyltransferase involved in cell wall biosynthesis
MQAVGRWSANRGDVHYRAVGDYARATNCRSMGLDLSRSTAVPRGIRLAQGDVEGHRSDFGLPEDGPLFVNVARRVPEKAQHLLVEAFAVVRDKLPGAHLAIAGAPGPADEAVRAAIAAHSLEGSVHLLGFRPDARALVSVADVFAFSSLSEGSPGVIVEALTLGAPVASFDIPPVVELTDGGRHAWLAPTGSVDGLADALLAAHGAPDRGERVRAALAWAERFQLDRVADRLADLLESRVTTRGPAAGADAEVAA